MSNPRIRVFIADDHKILIDSLIALLTGQNPNQLSPLDSPGNSPDHRDSGIVFVGRAETTAQVFERLAKMPKLVDVLLLDVNFTVDSAKKEGLAAVGPLKELYPDIKIIILTQYEDGEVISQAIQAGVHGYISKSMGKKDLLEGIQQVMKGEFVIKIPRSTPIPVIKSDDKEIKLTEIEHKILCCTIAEMTAAQIADRLKMTQTNVDRINRILRAKLEVQNVAGLVREAMKRHLCDDWEQVSGKQLPFSS